MNSWIYNIITRGSINLRIYRLTTNSPTTAAPWIFHKAYCCIYQYAAVERFFVFDVITRSFESRQRWAGWQFRLETRARAAAAAAFNGESVKSARLSCFCAVCRSRHHCRKFPKVPTVAAVTFYVLVSELPQGNSAPTNTRRRRLASFSLPSRPAGSSSSSSRARDSIVETAGIGRVIFISNDCSFLRRELPSACSPRGRIIHFPRFRHYAHSGLPHKFTPRR